MAFQEDAPVAKAAPKPKTTPKTTPKAPPKATTKTKAAPKEEVKNKPAASGSVDADLAKITGNFDGGSMADMLEEDFENLDLPGA